MTFMIWVFLQVMTVNRKGRRGQRVPDGGLGLAGRRAVVLFVLAFLGGCFGAFLFFAFYLVLF